MQHNKWLLVDRPAKLERARKDIAGSAVIGIDTEYDSFRYFREKLCLIQIKAQKNIYIFDPLYGIDISFLGDYFASPFICKVMHAGDNDIRILKRDYGFSFNNIFDTHRAASMLGCSRLSLASVVEEFLGIEFEKAKKIQRSQWDQRPLSEEQLQYAANDTAHLFDLHKSLEGRLAQAGLKEEAAEIFSGMTEVKWHEKSLNRAGHKKIPGYYALTDIRKERLKRLFRWRYLKAKSVNRAFFMILSDHDLLSLSNAEIEHIDDLTAQGLLSGDKARNLGQELVELLSEG